MTEDLLKLAEQCEAATGPVRELDAEIAVALGLPPQTSARYRRDAVWTCENGYNWHCPKFTATLDAAMSLVPEGCGFHLDRYWIASRKEPAWLCEISTGGVPSNPRQVYAGDDAWLAALAVTAAAIRARAAALQGEDLPGSG